MWCLRSSLQNPDPKGILEEFEALKTAEKLWKPISWGLWRNRNYDQIWRYRAGEIALFILLPVNKALTAFTPKKRTTPLARAHPISSATSHESKKHGHLGGRAPSITQTHTHAQNSSSNCWSGMYLTFKTTTLPESSRVVQLSSECTEARLIWLKRKKSTCRF